MAQFALSTGTCRALYNIQLFRRNSVVPLKPKRNYKAVLFAQKWIYLAANGTGRLLKFLHITFSFLLLCVHTADTLEQLFIDLMHDLCNRIAVLKRLAYLKKIFSVGTHTLAASMPGITFSLWTISQWTVNGNMLQVITGRLYHKRDALWKCIRVLFLFSCATTRATYAAVMTSLVYSSILFPY